MSKIRHFSKETRNLIVPLGKRLNLEKYDTRSDKNVPPREEAEKQTFESVQKIGELQDLLYADGTQALLVILQGLDGSGKDGTVRHVFDAVNPTGVTVTSFKTPTPLELRHDFLWRSRKVVPPRGLIGVFNRSYYEDVLVVRVHPHLLPEHLQGDKKLWERRFKFINGSEVLLHENNTRVLKFFLHISKEEQRERFIARQKDPMKNWKLSAADFEERKYWDEYQRVYEETLAATSTDIAPWYVIPSDRKWVRNYHIARIIRHTLEEMKLKTPQVKDPSLITKRFQ